MIVTCAVVITAVATAVGAAVTMKNFNYKAGPTILKDGIITNTSPRPVVIGAFESKGCTFGGIEHINGQGRSYDTGKNFINIDVTIYNGEKITTAPKYVYKDGKKYTPRLAIQRMWLTFLPVKWKIVFYPYKEVS